MASTALRMVCDALRGYQHAGEVIRASPAWHKPKATSIWTSRFYRVGAIRRGEMEILV